MHTSVNHCTLTPVCMCPLLRCWKALRLWTTACCSGFTTWTRQRGRGRWRAPRAAAMRRGPWPSRRPCTPQPWSPSREEQPAEGPSTLMTREFSQRDKRMLAVELGDKCDFWHILIIINTEENQLTMINLFWLELTQLLLVLQLPHSISEANN